MLRHGTYAKTRPTLRGEQHFAAKLTEQTVKIIRQRYKTGSSVADIARELAINYQTCYDVVRGKSWRHVA